MVVTDLSTASFLAALDRFLTRKGEPVSIYIHRWINFVGAASKFRKIIQDPVHKDQLATHVTCEWYFNPSITPHFGGIWEAAVKFAKSLLVQSLHNLIWSLEEMITALYHVR